VRLPIIPRLSFHRSRDKEQGFLTKIWVRHQGDSILVAIEHLEQIPIFQDFSEDILKRLALSCDEIVLGPNEFVLRQNDSAQFVFFLTSGSVQFLMHFEGIDDLLVGVTREYGALIGWSPFRPPFRYTTSVRCEETCRLFRLPCDILSQMFEDNPHVAVAVSNRMEQARERVVLARASIRRESLL
jgi:CRP-like cAMP-binding protein